jgi:hypothetical protein
MPVSYTANSNPCLPHLEDHAVLAVLVLVGIPDNESRDTIVVWLRVGGIQECQRSITSLLRIVGRQKLLEAGASVQVVLKRDVGRQVGAGVQRARSLPIIEARGEGMLEDPVGAGLGCVETLGCAVAGVVDAILEEEIDLRHDARDVDSAEIADAAAVVGGCLELWELMLGDLAAADGVVVVGVVAGEHVDIGVVIVVLIADAETFEGGAEDGGGEEEGGENGVGCEQHFGLRLI